MTNNFQMELRELQPEDEPFIYSSWMRSHRESDRHRSTPDHIYNETQKSLIAFHLANSPFLIASTQEDPSIIMGYLCFARIDERHTYLNYLYVKEPYRKLCIAKRMLASIASADTTFVCTNINEKVFYSVRKSHQNFINEREFDDRLKGKYATKDSRSKFNQVR